ncbi:cytochrome p450 [Moniliophthora roreri]|nr:cytochrome p450 [Moniliophthora roreri]
MPHAQTDTRTYARVEMRVNDIVESQVEKSFSGMGTEPDNMTMYLYEDRLVLDDRSQQSNDI